MAKPPQIRRSVGGQQDPIVFTEMSAQEFRGLESFGNRLRRNCSSREDLHEPTIPTSFPSRNGRMTSGGRFPIVDSS